MVSPGGCDPISSRAADSCVLASVFQEVPSARVSPRRSVEPPLQAVYRGGAAVQGPGGGLRAQSRSPSQEVPTLTTSRLMVIPSGLSAQLHKYVYLRSFWVLPPPRQAKHRRSLTGRSITTAPLRDSCGLTLIHSFLHLRQFGG